MTRRKLFAITLASLTVGFVALLGSAPAQPAADKPIQLGMAKTFFNDLPQVFIDIAVSPFGEMLKKTTALEGKLITSDGPTEVAQKLNNGQTQIGVFHGFEFAWAQKQYPQLQPILIAVNKHRDVRTFIVVQKDNPAKTIAHLRGKTLAWSLGTKEHCRAYIDRKCTDNNQQNPGAFFAKIARSKSAEDSLDEVCRKEVDAAIVDTIALEYYKDINLPRYTVNLRILQQSESFPEVVIAYKKGVLNEATLSKFREGLLKAHEDKDGREMMTMWHIHAFESVPANFTKSLADFMKEYPAPEPTKVSLR